MEYDKMGWEKLDNFDNSGNNWSISFKKIILKWILQSKTDDILDIACCTGHYIRKLREKGWDGNYIGVDVTPKLIKAAKQLSPDDTFFIQDARNLMKVKSGSHDMVLLLGVIMHLDNYNKAIQEAFRVSSDKVIIMAYASGTDKTFVKKNKKFIFRYFARKDIIKCIPKGAVMVKEKLVGRRWVFMFEV